MKPPSFDNWLAQGWGIQVDTPHKLFRIISHIALLAQERTYAWRGRNDATWDFSASLFREIRDEGGEVTEERVRKREREILEEARRRGLGRDFGPSATDMHMLSVLQHHGVPTRLIDVTANPMTALWFATEDHRRDKDDIVRRSPGVLFAVDVTKTDWHETFQYGEQTWNHLSNPLSALYDQALRKSADERQMFRAFPALPDERMKAQEGFFLGSAVPKRHKAPGVLGLNPIGPAPGAEKPDKLLSTEKGQGRPGVQMISLRLPLEPSRSWFVGSLLMARLGIRRVSITRRDDGTFMHSVRCLRNHFRFSTPSANLGRECQKLTASSSRVVEPMD